jgi:ATP-dependent RNA helicase DDX56/DBP9
MKMKKKKKLKEKIKKQIEKEKAKMKTSKGFKEEYGVSRGIDFKNVKAVINFDFPLSVRSYVHRVGRTGRGGASGVAISFVTPTDHNVFTNVIAYQKKHGTEITPFKFKVGLVEGFRYRVEDMLRSVTRAAIRDARIAELKQEILNSKKLKAHFAEHAVDLQLLQHDKHLQQNKVRAHLKFVPKYLLPPSLVRQQRLANPSVAAATDSSPSAHSKRRAKRGHPLSKKKKKERAAGDPLKSFGSGGPKRKGKRKFAETSAGGSGGGGPVQRGKTGGGRGTKNQTRNPKRLKRPEDQFMPREPRVSADERKMDKFLYPREKQPSELMHRKKKRFTKKKNR